ncbi:TPA: hypothetical protein RUT62_000886 [Escherichia coli]|uniref:hypothetical protein n=1 Tax=Escherichia coli TaxID=562 RepID=UPI000BE5FB7F|nr:hypothetical protein [Escherichia coli]MBB6825005.1 hypothetical protein [Escherichia coli]UMW12580.1 hypothetical protein L6L56_13545 [Escherichia coli]HAL6144577.1 hypothetical protein [Escherichia coli]HDZ8298735.1 hypothetical protein [Escherichia coli]
MIIDKTELCYGIRLDLDKDGRLWITELMGTDTIVIEKSQATQLIAGLQKFTDGTFENERED